MNIKYFTVVKEVLKKNGSMTVNQISTSILFNKKRKAPIGLSKKRIIAVLRIMKKRKEVKKEVSHLKRTNYIMKWTLL